MHRSILSLFTVLILASSAMAGGIPAKTVIGWTFDSQGDLHGWAPNGHLSGVKVDADGLSATASDWDPFIISPVFDIPANPQQWIEIRMKCDKSGDGQVYWSNTMDYQYGGFLADKFTAFVIPGGGEWRTVIIHPFWHTEKKIIHMRLDLFQDAVFTIKSIKVMEPLSQASPAKAVRWDFSKGPEGWTSDAGTRFGRTGAGINIPTDATGNALWSPMLSIPTSNRSWAAVRLKAPQDGKAAFHWVTGSAPGLQTSGFNFIGDGRFHTYNIDLGSGMGWAGDLVRLALTFAPPDLVEHAAGDTSFTKGNRVEIASISLENDMTGPPDLFADYIGMENAVNRVGKPCAVMARFVNRGGTPTSGIEATVSAPKGVSVRQIEAPAIFDPLIPAAFRYEFTSQAPVDGYASVRIKGAGATDAVYKMKLTITPSPAVEKTGYVPEVHPAKTDYRIGQYYFPGWDAAGKWEPINRVAPIRKPLLGWYDEANPECADWQIKWAAEHGISFFLVDWYWNQGSRMLDHWLHNAYMKSRYRKNLQWAVMWANHNPPGSHSVEDWKNVTKYWIDNYFGMDEYMRIDGKPAVFIWSPGGVRDDVGGAAGSAKLLAMSQQMAKDAGYAGITFGALNDGGSPSTATTLVTEGYTINTEYHWVADAMSLAKDPMYFPYSLVVDRSRQTWESRAKITDAAGLKFYPTLDTGWDARPWHGDKSFTIYGRTVAQFERLLKEAKSLMDSRGEKTLVLGPCNEWGEGSYTEPCTEFGFGMYDAVRRVFCDDTPHQDIAPIDVGLGPYDLAMPKMENRTSWLFDKPGDTQGWYSIMNLTNTEIRDGALYASVIGADPAFGGPVIHVRAGSYPYAVVRMKASPAPNAKDVVQLFWATSSTGVSGASMMSLDLIADGEFHTYVFPVGTSPRWRGYITLLRLDPCSTIGMEVWIDKISLSAKLPK